MNNASYFQNAIKEAQDQLKSCTPEERSPHALFEATKTAAEKGDDFARQCFIQGRFEVRVPGLEDASDAQNLPQTDVDTYLALAPKYIQEGLARGDWNTVALLATQRVGVGDLLLRTKYGVGTPSTEYKFGKLLQLGANKDFARSLGTQLDAIASPGSSDNPEFPRAEVQAAEKWANDMYISRFASSPRLDEMPTPCVAPQ